MAKELLKKYRELNESFPRKMIFHFGTGLGFYSELNTMLLCVLYCLKYKYQFVLYSKDCQFAFGNGWEEFFEEFCPTYNNAIVGKSIGRGYEGHSKKSTICHIYKLLSRNTILNDIYWYCRSSWFEKEHFYIPELGINGDIRDALRVIIPIVYRFNEKYSKLISDFENEVGVKGQYVSMHVRGGDKITERNLITPQKYIDIAEEKTDCRVGFVFTDDYRLFQDLKEHNPSWSLYTSAFMYEQGFVNSSFLAKDKITMERELVKIFASIDLIVKSELFIGTYSSNPGLFVGMQMNDEQMIGVDYDRWFII